MKFYNSTKEEVAESLNSDLAKGLDDEGAQVLKKKQDESGLVVASGLLGGESIVGVLVALSAVVMGMGA